MSYLRRKIDKYLVNWKAVMGHKPLIVNGPRQVGKIESNSVAYKSDYEMNSLDFEEFLWEKGYENIVAEAFSKSGYVFSYYKRNDSTLEEDFFVRTAENLIPVEVKATNGRAKSLRMLIASENMRISDTELSFVWEIQDLVTKFIPFRIFVVFC